MTDIRGELVPEFAIGIGRSQTLRRERDIRL